ncbi:putative glutamyl-tRNA(Gln) amidotransferase subunit A, mitochondrial isoform X1 [Penaeus vannamei]|uniref:Glutamyl-tRNA(Gln) amidotransferase subunit A, mitochondrial n=1 Tax=Penaeus vannamei TaxID=6689 RepID=A0A423TR35_PENVA|nr:putative glutamyl-tRNA(Gln) amidotransferase subunit A, mitochondrial isoform X1 [Penaeus vannamei]
MNHLLGSAKDVLGCLRQGSVSAVELVEAALRQQENVARLNAFISRTSETALKAADESQKRYEKKDNTGPLEGLPVAVKDNFCTAGIPTTCGSKMLQNYVPPYSATVVKRLERAGAVIIGKTNLDEFAMGSGTVDSSFGPTRNIYRSGIRYQFQNQQELKEDASNVPTEGLDGDWFIAGGSSDTGGSVRNPASYCGVVGFKPSYGVVPRAGLISLVNSMDVPGLFGRYVDDVATMLGVVAGQDSQDSTSVSSDLSNLKLPEEPCLDGLVVGIPREYHCPGVSSEVVDMWTKVADIMEDSGAELRQVSMPHTKYSILCYSVLNPCEVASNFTRYTGVEYGHRVDASHSMEAMYALTRSAGLNDVVRGRILAGNYFLLRENKEKYYKQALKVRRLILQDFENVWNSGVDFLLTPVTLSAAMRYSEFCQIDNRTQTATQDICTQASNMAGVPAVTVPVSLNGEGLPLSLQLMAPTNKDAALLSVAKWIEQRVNFPRMCIS